MRVATRTNYDTVKYNLNYNTSELTKANQIVSSGKRIQSLSDDPVGLAQALNIRSGIDNLEQLGRNITFGKPLLTAAESALTSIQDLTADAKALAVSMANTTVGPDERANAAATIKNYMEEIVSLGNTDVNGRYIFAGTKTDTKPFAADGSYSGNNEAFAIKIGRDANLTVGNDGEAVLGTIFTTLSDLKTALENNDIVGIQTGMTQLGDDYDRFGNKISEIGSKMIRAEIKETIFADMKIANTDRLSRIQDADIAEAITELSAKELAYKAALSSATKVMDLSLLDYLR